MARTTVSHVTLTVSTVEVFINTVRYISEQEDLWDDIQAYLAENGKIETFVDFDFLRLTRELMMQDGRCDTGHPVVKILVGHEDPD